MNLTNIKLQENAHRIIPFIQDLEIRKHSPVVMYADLGRQRTEKCTGMRNTKFKMVVASSCSEEGRGCDQCLQNLFNNKPGGGCTSAHCMIF